MIKLELPFTQTPDGTWRTAACVGDTLTFAEANHIGLTVAVTQQPSGANVTVTNSASTSTTDALTRAGVHKFSVVSTLGGYSFTAIVFVWPAATIGASGPLVYTSGQALVDANKTTDAKRREVLRSIARECSPSAADALFVATGFSGALIGSSIDAINPSNYGL